MQRRYTDSIAENLAQEPGGPVAYFGFLAFGVWYFVSGWAAGSGIADGGVLHFIFIAVACLAAVFWAGASLHEIDQVGHTGRLMTAVMWCYCWYWFGRHIEIEGLWIIAFWFGYALFEIPLNIIERIACSYRRLGGVIRECYKYGTVAVMGLMLMATLTSGFSEFLGHGKTAWMLKDAYRFIQGIIVLGWW
ncbi:hypothetical protein [Pontibacterium sp.]|uniref:hypothetical protein n=1 Tax=Pontibacterium sp. TaxID=2036026 RepID=UPI0035164604